MNPWGAPGPDGFQPGFFKANWGILGPDIIKATQDFFRTGIMEKDFNHSFITLIPKISTPQTPADFRPISLSNTIYKLISKILANRLKPLLNRLISPNQSVFLPERQITDNIIIAHELIHSMKTSKKKKGFLALKIGLLKAFDRVEWPFIKKALTSFGFSDCWVNLIFQCISTTSYSILLNGSPGPNFSTSRGLRQGDPLSPYLFLICMEVLYRLLVKATEENKISGIKINKNAPSTSHLFFADDCFLFTKADLGEAKNLLDILSKFGEITGQLVNLQKSGIYFSPKIHPKHGKIIAKILRVPLLTKKDRYLGTPLFFDKNRKENFEPLLQRYYNTLQGWKAKLLSQAGRTVLIQSILQSYPTYQMQMLAFQKKLQISLTKYKGIFGGTKIGQKEKVVI